MKSKPNLEVLSTARRRAVTKEVLASLPIDRQGHVRLQSLVGVVHNWAGIAELASRYMEGDWIFRGQSFPSALVPTIGRESARRSATSDSSLIYDHNGERWIVEEFERRSRPYLSHVPLHKLEWLAIAQHHGLPTRLLDWTESFLVAVSFAVERAGVEGPATILALRRPVVAESDADPYKVKIVKLYRPPHIAPRIPAQQGVFTVHPRPAMDYRPEGLEQWIIRKSACFNIKKQLHTCGINESVLFPDIDGLARYLRWRYKRSKSIKLD